jgi:eukaryotic-like serine/threonine-protein kinase
MFAGRYEIQSRLGSGGMAEVLLARDRGLGRLVALKLLAPSLADPTLVERFRREATAIASLNHPNVVVIYDHGVADEQPFIAMEYVDGRTLKQIIGELAPLAPDDAAAYARQALDGLAAAHAVGIVHRDVKPQNLLVREDGTLKVADFGVARSADETMLTQHGSVIGTAEYISPEQAQGELASPASDLYSLGVVLFEMLTGELPFRGELPLAIANQHVLEPAPSVLEINPAVPADLAHVVRRALNKEPSLRYESAAAMRAALTDAPTERPAPTLIAPPVTPQATQAATEALPRARPGSPIRTGRLTRRAKLLVTLAAAALLLVVAFALARRGTAEPRRVALPQVVGRPVASAASVLRARGFAVRIASAQHAAKPTGTVAAVRPSVASAALGTTLTLVPSSGPRAIAVPSVTGYSEQAATAVLEKAGLIVQPRAVYAPVPSGTAVGTTPPAGDLVPPHSPIALIISAGPAPIVSDQPALAPGKAKGHDKSHGHGDKKGEGGD